MSDVGLSSISPAVFESVVDDELYLAEQVKTHECLHRVIKSGLLDGLNGVAESMTQLATTTKTTPTVYPLRGRGQRSVQQI